MDARRSVIDLVGGPFDGKHFEKEGPPSEQPERIACKIRGDQWAVYALEYDGSVHHYRFSEELSEEGVQEQGIMLTNISLYR